MRWFGELYDLNKLNKLLLIVFSVFQFSHAGWFISLYSIFVEVVIIYSFKTTGRQTTVIPYIYIYIYIYISLSLRGKAAAPPPRYEKERGEAKSKYMIRKCITILRRAAKGRKKEAKGSQQVLKGRGPFGLLLVPLWLTFGSF